VCEVAARGAAVLLSSHILAEVETLCDTVTIIRSGRTVQAGSLDQLRHLMRTKITVQTRTDTGTLRGWPDIHDFTTMNGHVSFTADRNKLDEVMFHLTKLGIVDLAVAPASLEDLFLREYRSVRQ
jgi:ABC-2 type transport system ATP-binding protein